MLAGTDTTSTTILMITLVALLVGCAQDDPDENGDIPDAGPGEGEPCTEDELEPDLDLSECSPADTDYTPNDNGSADDTWPACISDDNTYHQIEESISSISRVEAYEQIGEFLWKNTALTPEDFVDARIIYEAEQGLGSRVARRYDVHYNPPPGDASCEDEGIPEKYPDYCVGPATLQPIVTEGFADGSLGEDMVVNAAKIEAALQWFLYVSTIKEGTTCINTPKDCDSCWAYYCGGTPRNNPIGLAADIERFVPLTHDRAYDGVLAVRCWRDLDPAVPAEDLELQAQAINQLDIAVLHGMAVLVRQRFFGLSCATGEYQEGTLEALRILVPLLDRATRERSPSVADQLLAEIDNESEDIDYQGMMDAIDSVYDCP